MKGEGSDRQTTTDVPGHVATQPTRSELQRSRHRAAKTRKRRARRRVLGRMLLILAVVALIAVGFVALRPQSLGGSLAYIEMHGDSMVPTLHDGDLVVAEHQSTYGLGEIVVYRVPTGQPGAGAVVIARIVGGTTSTGFVTRGDGSVVSDPVHPKASDILGRVRLHVPMAAALVVAGVAVMVVVAVVLALVTRRRRRTRRAVSPAPTLVPVEYPSLEGEASVDVPEAMTVPAAVKSVDTAPAVAPDPTSTAEAEPAPVAEATPQASVPWAVATPDPTVSTGVDPKADVHPAPKAAPGFVDQIPVTAAIAPKIDPEPFPMAEGHPDVFVSASKKDKRRRRKLRSPGPGQGQLPGIGHDGEP